MKAIFHTMTTPTFIVCLLISTCTVISVELIALTTIHYRIPVTIFTKINVQQHPNYKIYHLAFKILDKNRK